MKRKSKKRKEGGKKMEKKKRVIRGIGDALAYLIGRPSKVETKKELETSQKTEEEVKKEDGQER